MHDVQNFKKTYISKVCKWSDEIKSETNRAFSLK